MSKYVECEALKAKKVYCVERHELVVPVAEIDWMLAADVEIVRHGRWIWDKRELYPKPICSECKQEPWRRSNHQSDLPNYCPNCGAKMDLM